LSDRSDTSSPSEAARIRQTLESIVVAFILAFVFRAFVIEAFVIPTGSMAATLYGEHMTFVCPDCGYEYAYGWSGQQRQHRRIVCPNCEYEFIGRGRVEGGDRILVFKFPYDLGGKWLGPKRWDVCVFKNPGDGQTNFIKRLIGLPEEVIEIIDGDIYAAPAAEIDPAILDILAHPPWDRPPLTAEQRAELDEAMKIRTKPDSAQGSLWFTLYDQDYPTTRPRNDDRPADWTAPGDESAWQAYTRELSFDGVGRPLDHIQFTGKNVTDFYAYNGEQFERRQIVSDLRASAVLIPHASQGQFEILLGKRDELFRLLLHLDGSIELSRLRVGKTEPPDEMEAKHAQIEPFEPGLAYQVTLSNVDHVTRVELDGRILLSMPRPTDPAVGREAAKNRVEPRILLGAADTRLTLRHVRLQRDVFYRSPLIEEEYDDEVRDRRNPHIRRPGWATSNHPLYLRRGEYFVLGDNSPESKDSRLWWHACELLEPAGPLRDLLGRQMSALTQGTVLDDAQAQQLRHRVAGMRRTLGRAPRYRQEELSQAADRIERSLVEDYIPAAQNDPRRALALGGELARLLADVDWRYYHLGTVPADQMIGRAFFVYWPAGVAPLKDTGDDLASSLRRGGLLGRLAYRLLYGGIIPNVGRMRFVR